MKYSTETVWFDAEISGTDNLQEIRRDCQANQTTFNITLGF